MQSYLLGLTLSSTSSSDGGGGLLLLHPWSPGASSGVWLGQRGGPRTITDRAGSVVASAHAGRDHYSVLGVPRSASPAEVKRAYRLLARKYHPDVSKDSQDGEIFKNIRAAYEALSNDATRAQYDRELKFQEAAGRTYQRNCTYDSELDDRRKIYRWAELRYRMQYERRKRPYHDIESENYVYSESPNYKREPFDEVLWSALFTLFFLHTIGSQFTLAFCNLKALLDNQLDAGYKMGYTIAWFMGGQGGVLLTICISFASWLCGKNSSGLVSLFVLAMWVGIHLSRFVPFPQGALLAMLYVSIRLQLRLKWNQ